MNTKSDPIGPQLTNRGTISELAVASLLLKRGHAIFLPLDKQGPVDFITVGPNGVRRCQVKTARQSNSKERYLRCDVGSGQNRKQRYDDDAFDDLWVVGPGGEFWCVPWSDIRGQFAGRDSKATCFMLTKADKWRIA